MSDITAPALNLSVTKGTDFRPARRLPAAQVTHWNSW
jgi:hypothetical protein